MKIAYLILAHHNPGHLHRLLRALDDPRADFFLHIDKKKNIEEFDLDRVGLVHSKLTCVDRHKILWGDISIVEAMLTLYKTALESGDYDRFMLLSGDDYPLRSNDEIVTFLSQDREFTRCAQLHASSSATDYWFWKLKNMFLIKSIRRITRFLKIQRKYYIPVGGEKWSIYLSSQWQALTREGVQTLLKTLEENPQILRYFRFSRAPDELLIPTVLGNIPHLREKTYPPCQPETFANRPVLHYLQMERQKGSSVSIFTEKDFDDAMASGKLFIRKTIPGVSDGLLERIDESRKDGIAGKT